MKEGIGSVVIPLPRYGDLTLESKLLVSTQSNSPEEAQGKCRACRTHYSKNYIRSNQSYYAFVLQKICIVI